MIKAMVSLAPDMIWPLCALILQMPRVRAHTFSQSIFALNELPSSMLSHPRIRLVGV